MGGDVKCQDVTANELIALPQADDVDKIRSIPELVIKGYDTPTKMGEINKMTTRQGSYYLEAARALGIVERKDGAYRPTRIGLEIAGGDRQKQNQILMSCILRLPIIVEIIKLAKNKGLHGVSREDIISLIERKTEYRGTTLMRRTTTLTSYIEWVSKRNNMIVIKFNKIYYNG